MITTPLLPYHYHSTPSSHPFPHSITTPPSSHHHHHTTITTPPSSHHHHHITPPSPHHNHHTTITTPPSPHHHHHTTITTPQSPHHHTTPPQANIRAKKREHFRTMQEKPTVENTDSGFYDPRLKWVVLGGRGVGGFWVGKGVRGFGGIVL